MTGKLSKLRRAKIVKTLIPLLRQFSLLLLSECDVVHSQNNMGSYNRLKLLFVFFF